MRIRPLGVQEVRKPTCEQVDNVRRLILTLEKVAVEYPEHFDMRHFVNVKDNIALGQLGFKERNALHQEGMHPTKCGTTGCALGWLPYTTGIPVPILESGAEDWNGYAGQVLGIYSVSWYDYCFLDWDEDEIEGESGAIAAANRLREWLTLHEGDCVQ